MVEEKCLAEVRLEPVRVMVWVSVELEVAFEGHIPIGGQNWQK